MNERERIELLMKCYDLSPSQFADKTGIQRASVSHILSGRNKPSLEVMLKVYDAFPGVDMKWLMTGVGEVPVRQTAQDSVVSSSDTLFSGAGVTPVSSSLEGGLFAPVEPVVQPAREESRQQQRRVATQQQPVREKSALEARPKRSQSSRIVQMMPLQSDRKIKEIRIYYSDGTYETLVPERLG